MDKIFMQEKTTLSMASSALSVATASRVSLMSRRQCNAVSLNSGRAALSSAASNSSGNIWNIFFADILHRDWSCQHIGVAQKIAVADIHVQPQ